MTVMNGHVVHRDFSEEKRFEFTPFQGRSGPEPSRPGSLRDHLPCFGANAAAFLIAHLHVGGRCDIMQ